MGIPLYCWKASWKIPATKIEDLEVTPHSLGNPHNDVGTDKPYIIFVFFPLKKQIDQSWDSLIILWYSIVIYCSDIFYKHLMRIYWENHGRMTIHRVNISYHRIYHGTYDDHELLPKSWENQGIILGILGDMGIINNS
jgi:hypothetical protein